MLSKYALDDILTDLFRLQLSKFLNVAALAAFVFDYCLTFSTEVECVWGTKWQVTRIVFTVSRYLPFISASLTCYDSLVNEGCGSFILALDAMYTVSIISAEGVLILRTHAVWGRSKRVLVFLVLLAGAFIAGAQVLSWLINVSLPGDSTSFYQFYPFMCAYQSPRSAALQYALLMVYELILQSMNSWRKFRTYRDLHSRTLNMLYWDGILYMWWIIVLSGVNMAVKVAAPITYTPALDTAQVAIHSVLASRIFFNLRKCDGEFTSFGDEHPLNPLHYQASIGVLTTIGAPAHTSNDIVA